MSVPVKTAHIELRTGPRRERAYVSELLIRTQEVVLCHEESSFANEIIERVTTLPLAEMHTALGYYSDRQSTVDQHIREDESIAMYAERVQYAKDRYL